MTKAIIGPRRGPLEKENPTYNINVTAPARTSLPINNDNPSYNNIMNVNTYD